MTNKVVKPTNREILQNNLNRNKEKNQISVSDLHAVESGGSPKESQNIPPTPSSNMIILGQS